VTIERMRVSWWSLRIALGATAFLAGLDKFFNLLANWPAYLSPPVAALPISASSFMHVVGVIEMAVGKQNGVEPLFHAGRRPVQRFRFFAALE